MRLFTTFHQLNGHKLQPWKLAVAVGNAIVNAALRGIYDRKKIVVIKFSMSLFSQLTILLVISERLINLLCIV